MTGNFWQKLKKKNKPILALAPMAGVTDSAFRQICKYYGADVVYTEMISADGLYYDSHKTLGLLKFKKSEQPVVIQLFGKNPSAFVKAAKICEDVGFAGIDINFGCPAKKVVASGGGVTLMRDLDKCRQIIEAVLAGTKLPISIKVRASIKKEGSDERISALDFIRYIKDLPVSAVMVHGRPHENPFGAAIDYEMIKNIKQEFAGVVLANGGITKPEEAKIMIDKTQADGLGLARGLYGRPWLFKQVKDYLKIGKYKEFKPSDIKKAMIKHARMSFEAKGDYGLIELRKHLLWYVAGWSEAKKLRSELVRVKTLSDIKKILKSTA
ncbi:MAG: tRNA-dihydrouridine synthase [Candidatus Buchananbacteria bacterium]|nr:tRNA-dihydrouridine synthase [Candidatus Buchananbacteria bacterium]